MIEWIFLFIAGLVIASYDAVVGSGGLLMVSAFSLAGIPLLPAIGTMRVVTLVQEGVSAATFYKKLELHNKAVLFYGSIAAFGGLIGSLLTVQVSEQILSFLVGILLLGLLIVIPQLDFSDDCELVSPWTEVKNTCKRILGIKSRKKLLILINRKTVLLSISCFGLSVYGGFYGAGFGTLSLFPFFVIGHLGILRSAAYARVIGFCMSLTASAVFIFKGSIDWSLAIPLGAGTIIGSFLGVHLATKMNLSWLKYLLVIITLAASIDLLLSGSGITR